MTISPVKASLVALTLFSAAGVAEAAATSAAPLLQVAQTEAAQPEPKLEDPPLPPYDPNQEVQPEPQLEQPPLPPADPPPEVQPEPKIEEPPLPPADPGKEVQPEPKLEDPPLPPYDPSKEVQPEPKIEQPPLPPAEPGKVQGQQQLKAKPPVQPASNVNPALEQRAQAYLQDSADVRTMKRKQLRKRLSDIRDLLASDQLSPQTSEALRQLLARERLVLRNDVAGADAPPPATTGQQPGTRPATGGNADPQLVLRDRRPPQQLDDRALVNRIDVYRGAVGDDRYDAEQRMLWRQQMEEDRRFLRRQMMAERQLREQRLRSGEITFNIIIDDDYDPGYDGPDDAFAAEIDDSELAGVLAAPPRRAIDRRYTLDDIERSPDIRNAMARIEIDTVHFGFGEGFLREEEIDKLDRIAEVLEKILARHPDEIFLIEGHTDAVGSDQANLRLSRQRAMAVKDALATYYVIPPDNLRTVGLGERYLKIPTDQPEAENRRVSLARITPLVGQAN